MRILLNDGGQPVELVSEDHFLGFYDEAHVQRYLARLLEDPDNRQTLRAAYARDNNMPAATHVDDMAVGLWLARKLLAGRVRILAHNYLYLHGYQVPAARAVQPGDQEPVEMAPGRSGLRPASPEETEPEPVEFEPDEPPWLDIELVDEQGRPVPGELYTVELPDGTFLQGSLDPNGKARIRGVDAQTAKVSFPNYDADAYDLE
ncbi:MAG: hypothetical protein H6739_15800 [Alphaproteobacteria bacterium]|nr:hypothetical protein [Alphaproteobacteria bacterium]